MFTVSASAAWLMLCSPETARMRMCTSLGPIGRSWASSSFTTREMSKSSSLPPTRSRSAAIDSVLMA
jgi:hypothetical protein